MPSGLDLFASAGYVLGMDDVMDSIFDVWNGAEDVQEHGPDYLGHIIAEDLRRLEGSDGADEAAVEALCDVAINSIRGIHELTGDNPKDLILERLESRKGGDRNEVVEEYVANYERSRD